MHCEKKRKEKKRKEKKPINIIAMAIEIYEVRFKFSGVNPGTWLHGILLNKGSRFYMGKPRDKVGYPSLS